MAQGKKSFVLYADLIDLLDGDEDTPAMSDEDAGLLFKTILRYVNDLNPKIPSSISQSFTFIKKRLKADLVKYEEQKERMNRINEERSRKKEERSRNDVDTMSCKVDNDVVGDKCNMLNDKCNMLNEVSKDTNNSKASAKPVHHKFGQYGWVKLTDAEYKRLIDEYGESKINIQIDLLDAYIQENGNKNKYKDWNLVLRKSIRDDWFKNAHSNTWKSTNKRDINAGWDVL